MSNKHKNIENRGWEGMSELLDKHLPQEKKRRPVFPFWSITAAASLMLISSLFLFNKENSQNPSIVEIKQFMEVKSKSEINQKIENKANLGEITENSDVANKAEKQNSSISNAEPTPMIPLHDYTPKGIAYHSLNQEESKALNFTAIGNEKENKSAALAQNSLIAESIQNIEQEEETTSNSILNENTTVIKTTPVELQRSSTSESLGQLTINSAYGNNNNVSNRNSADDNNPANISIFETKAGTETSIDPNTEGLTLVGQSESKNDLYLRPSINALFNTDDNTKSASVGIDLGYKIKKVSVEVGAEYISNNAVTLTTNEVKDYVSNRLLDIQAIKLPIENLSDLKSSSYQFNNGRLLAISAKVHFDITEKFSVYGGLQRSKSKSYKSLEITSNGSSSQAFNLNEKTGDLNILNGYLLDPISSGIYTVGSETTGMSYLLGLSYKILKKLNINIGVRSNFRPKNSINEYAVANNLPLFAVGASYKLF